MENVSCFALRLPCLQPSQGYIEKSPAVANLSGVFLIRKECNENIGCVLAIPLNLWFIISISNFYTRFPSTIFQISIFFKAFE